MDLFISEIKQHLQPSSILLPNTPSFASYTTQWSLHHSAVQPKLVLVPKEDIELAATVKLLYNSPFSFSVRSGGIAGSQNEDVVLSMEAFDGFKWNEKEKTVLLGAGQNWRTVYQKMEKFAPDYMVVGARTPIVGVGGSIIAGGSSWLSPQYGWGSDPANFLDARVVIHDGREVWASEEDGGRLLWALRGGQGNFGVVKSFLLRAHPYPREIYGGSIFFDASAFPAFAKQADKWLKHNSSLSRGTTFHLLMVCVDPSRPSFGVQIFDPLGKEHAKGSEPTSLGWIWEVDGRLSDDTGLKTFCQIVAGYENMCQLYGTMNTILYAPLTTTVDEETFLRGWKWFADATKPSVFQVPCTLLVFEIDHAATGSSDSTAWPRSERTTVVQLAVGFRAQDDAGTFNKVEMEANRIIQSGRHIVGVNTAESDCFPNAPADFLQPKSIFQGNYAKLQQLKTRYDPQGKFNKNGLYIPPL
ncbi:FAD-binding domain-containing protein [Atractiella rhizophila]|nr:FAD-binding domain-containing protein [Atractiella rhizophila]